MKRYEGLHPMAKKFEACANDLTEQLANYEIGQHRAIVDGILFTLKNRPRFFLPLGINILDGKDFNDFKQFVRLPFDNFCLLAPVLTAEGKEYLRIIWVQQNANNPVKFFFHATYEIWNDDKGLSRQWRILPYWGGINLAAPPEQSKTGYTIEGFMPPGRDPTPDEVDFSRSELGKIGESLFNLCVLLSLANVKTEEHMPPEKLNVRRIKSNVLPLRSFFTLVVDGERWDGAKNSVGEGSGVRSHMRRGHIRRLDELRHIWVRATVVHGRRPGFVEKTYTVEKPEET